MQAEYRGVEQLVARRAHNPEVVGSSPASATKFIRHLAFMLSAFFVKFTYKKTTCYAGGGKML